MSLFLGKIHYWLFNKIVWFEGIEEEVKKVIKEKNLPLDQWQKEIYSKYQEPTDGSPLEDIIDTSNIHGWLHGRISSAEGRQAAFITKGVNALGEEFLNAVNEVYKIQGEKTAREYLIEAEKPETPAEIYTVLNNYILDGMPCDRATEVLENLEERLTFETVLDVHEEYWTAENGNVKWFHDARDKWILSFVENINSDFTFKKVSENTREISKK